MKKYLYANERQDNKYIVFEVNILENDYQQAENRCKRIAKKNKYTLAGGSFTENGIPYNFNEEYIVIKVKDTIKPLEDKIVNSISKVKTYNQTLIKKGKYKNYINFDIDDFICNLRHKNKPVNTWQDIEEDSFDWNLSISQYTAFKDLYNSEYMLKDAIDYIISKTNIERENIDQDAVICEIMTSCDNAYQYDYMTKLFKYTSNSIEDHVNELNINGQILYYSKEDNTLHTELKYNTSEIRLYISIDTIKELNKDYFRSEYTINEVIDNIKYELDLKSLTINYENFDHYGTVADYDNWLDAFKNNESISYDIINKRKLAQDKLKGKILNRVELIYR